VKTTRQIFYGLIGTEASGKRVTNSQTPKRKHTENLCGRFYSHAYERKRNEAADYYDRHLANVSFVEIPFRARNSTHVFHQYVVRTAKRDDLKAYLGDHEIGTLVHYPVPIHKQPAYAEKLPAVVSQRQTETIAAQILSLPMYPELTDDQVEMVCKFVTSWDRN